MRNRAKTCENQSGNRTFRILDAHGSMLTHMVVALARMVAATIGQLTDREPEAPQGGRCEIDIDARCVPFPLPALLLLRPLSSSSSSFGADDRGLGAYVRGVRGHGRGLGAYVRGFAENLRSVGAASAYVIAASAHLVAALAHMARDCDAHDRTLAHMVAASPHMVGPFVVALVRLRRT